MIGDFVRRISALLFTLFALVGTCATSLVLSATAAASESGTTYTPETPVVDTVSGGPWNTSQGDPSAGSAYSSSDLLPTFTFGGSETTLGGISEPNVAVYPGTGAVPYPSGVAGTPGPLDGYCSSLGANPETGTPVSQPPGTSLPFSPYYFPDVVLGADGSLTGYFDYRPKDADEAITVARSTDNGATWTSEGKALEQNPGYCPTADTNDDGQGHPYVASVGGSTKLYTLQRPAGDYEGVGLLVHNVEPSATNPLAALPASESVGIDPNTYAASAVEVPLSGGTTIPVSTLGSEGSPEHIVAGPYEDYNAASPSSSVITCAGTSATPIAELTGCTVAGSSPLTVNERDDLVQVIATANPGTGKTYTVPKGPNIPSGEGGLETLKILNGNSVVSPLTTFILNENAPNRLYIDGVTVYCAQANANPTTKVENCTTDSGSPLTVHQGDAITADPILPPNAAVTTGLKAPDGIVGTLPSYPGAPAGSTVVLYTEKILAYFIVGTTNGSVSGSTFKAGTVTLPAATINYTPSVHPSEPLPSTGSFKIYLGTAVGSPIQEVTCTGVTAATQTGVPSGSENLTGCTGGTGGVKEGNWVGGPNAAVASVSTLEKIGEGKNSSSKGPEKLFANNEDYTVLRAAYTENGINFTDLGPISGSTSGTGNDTGSYNDLSNPYQQTSPSSASPTNIAPGEPDTTELRFIGSRGTIITNPDGSYGMFLSGAWATDGDSDAFNQIFYTTSTNGKEWSVPKVVVSTDYTFSASAEQDESLAKGEGGPLGVSAYYSGRAYGPAVVQNPGGSLTMVFSGYRLPKPVTSVGTVLGTNAAARYTIGAKDPAIYRNILTLHLNAATSPGVSTTTSVGSSDEGRGVVGGEVTYTAAVAPVSPGTGTPTGTVSFSDSSGPIGGCGAEPLSVASPDVATCTTALTHAGADEVSASYSGDANYASSAGTTGELVDEAPAITSTGSATFTEGTEGGFTVTASGTPTPGITESGALPHGLEFNPATGVLSGTPTQQGVFPITFTAANGVGSNAEQSFTLTVDASPVITSEDSTTFTEGTEGSFTVTASGTPAPGITESGALPHGVEFNPATGVLSGIPTQDGTYPIKFTAANGVGSNAEQDFTLIVDSAPAITSGGGVTFTEGTEGSFSVTATGNPAPTIIESGPLPNGVKFNAATDVLSGTPAQEGVYPITFSATNGVGFSTQSFTLTVDAPPAITSADDATFSYGAPGTFTVTASGTPAPVIEKWGNLPTGVSYSDGVLSGTPTQIGTFEITFTASNGIGADSIQQFTLTVLGLHVTTASLPGVTLGAHFAQQLEAVGGVTAYRWKVTAGHLPRGLRLSSTGLLSGTVAAKGYPHGGSFPITVTVTDRTRPVHQTAIATFTLLVS
ncbi:MAG: putative Ig domain-containing protein [Solirubrobacteraceae bacterium]